MEIYSFKNVTFTYPEGERPALRNLSFPVKQGEFLILCGPSGCGKSTLLRHLKPCLTPHGVFSGEIFYGGAPLCELSQRQQARSIGFVLQSPENQVVTDKVWHELAFGLESLGCDTPTVRRRVAEIAAFFGIEPWFHKSVAELSGGQKQLLSLASVMAMQPDVLVLDEPTAQLDPIAAADFLAILGKINRELGTTVILTEHRLEEAFPYATRVLVMEQGAIVCDGKPEEVGLQLRDRGSGMFLAMPTAMRVISGLRAPYRGTVQVRGKVGHLPQNPQTLLLKRTVREDLFEIFRGTKTPREEQEALVERITALCGLSSFLDRHPYDISGGEQQRTALAKVLLTRPDILLLDEPTKGFDAEFKVTFARILRRLTAQGVTVLLVSHDVAFCAAYAHTCGLFFDGSIVAQGTPRDFFSGNSFYTTPANRMARQWIPRAVTVEDVTLCCGGAVPPEPELPREKPLPPVKETAVSFRPKPLPLWRKLLAGVSLAAALAVFLYATKQVNLSSLLGAGGITDAGEKHLYLYALLVAALVVFLAAIGRRSPPPAVVQTPVERRRLSRRTVFATAFVLVLIPVTVLAGALYLGNRYYNITAIAVLIECILPFFLVFEGRKPKARELVLIAVLCAMGVAGRMAFFMLPQFKPVMALVIIAGVSLGGETGFLVGAVTMLASNVLFSQGPWTPWQMFCMGIVGFLAGILFRKGFLRRSRAALAAFGAFAAVFLYGGIINPASALMYSAESINWRIVLGYYITGLPMDLVHGAATAIFLWLGAEPMLEKLDRIKTKYGLV